MWSQLISQVAASCKRNSAVIDLAKTLDTVMKNGGMTHRRAGRELMDAFVKDEYARLNAK
jgi:arginine/ornithine transport system ATPase